MIDFCLRWRKTVVLATVLMFVVSIAGFGFVQQQFFPTSTRTELFLEMRLPEGTAIGVTDATAKNAEQPDRRRRRRRDLHDLCGAGRAALLARPQSGAAELELRADRHRDEGSRGARARQGEARKAIADGALPRGAHPRRPLRVRPAGRLPGAVPRGRARSDEGARHRRGRPQGDGGELRRSSIRISTGASRSSRSASRWTRIAPARSG